MCDAGCIVQNQLEDLRALIREKNAPTDVVVQAVNVETTTTLHVPRARAYSTATESNIAEDTVAKLIAHQAELASTFNHQPPTNVIKSRC
jgi:hypothetical protein